MPGVTWWCALNIFTQLSYVLHTVYGVVELGNQKRVLEMVLSLITLKWFKYIKCNNVLDK